MRDTYIESELTPACTLGFLERLNNAMDRAGLHKSGFITFISTATGMSQSGVRRIFSDKRPPKRMEAMARIADSLVAKINARTGDAITAIELTSYLLEDKVIPAWVKQNDFDLSEFLKADPVLTSQVILKIEDIAKRRSIETSKDIGSNHMQLIYFRIVSYCFKNSAELDSPKVDRMVESLFDLAEQNLL